MLTIAQQRCSLTITELRIVQAELDLGNIHDLIRTCQINVLEPSSIRDALLLAERTLEDLSRIRSFLIKTIAVKEQDLARIMGSQG